MQTFESLQKLVDCSKDEDNRLGVHRIVFLSVQSL